MARELKCPFRIKEQFGAQNWYLICKQYHLVSTMIHQVFNMVAELTFYREDELFLGNTQIRLLKQVVKDGSINSATKNLKMSYQHAWHLLDRLNLLSPVPIVIRQKGGKDGGGCRISPYGMKLIRTYEKKVADIIRFLEQSNSELESCFF